MAGEMLVLTHGETDYVLSAMYRSYRRSYHFEGYSSRSITGTLNILSRARKTIHTIEWAALPYDAAPDGGLGLADLEGLYLADEEYTLTVLRYAPSNEREIFTVRFDPEEGFDSSLLPWVGMKRRFWRVKIMLLEV